MMAVSSFRRVAFTMWSAMIMMICAGCGEKPEIKAAREMMLMADGLMDSDPSRALAIMDSIDGSLLEGELTARYALLMTKAQNKNKQFATNDSLISIASEYYKGRGDSLEVQSLYYHGFLLTRFKDYEKALIYQTDAFMKAERTDDDFYAGMSARNLSVIYDQLDINDKSLEWIVTAKRKFERAGKSEHAAWCDIQIIPALIYTGRQQEASELIKNVDKSLLEESSYFRHSIMVSEAENLFHLGVYDSVPVIFDGLIEEGYEPDAYDYCLLGDAYIHSGKRDSTRMMLELAYPLLERARDSLYYGFVMSSLLIDEGKYEDAAHAAYEWGKEVMKDGDRRIMHPRTLLLTDYLSKQYANEQLQGEKNRSATKFLIIVLGLSIMIAIAVFIILKQRLKASRRERALLASRMENLVSDLRRTSETLSTLKEQNDEIIDEKADPIKMLGDMVQEYYDRSLRKKWTKREDIMSMKSFQSLKDYDSVYQLAMKEDSLRGGKLECFMNAFATMPNNYKMVVMLRYMNFSNESIMLLMNFKEIKSLYNIDNRIRKRMSDDGTVSAGRYLKEMGIYK